MPLLSIVVPTKDRHAYLELLVRSLLQMRSSDFEVVVHDNSGDNSAYIRSCGSITDERLRYYNEKTALAMTDNCDRALALARGEYVCMIGDDDGVTPPVIDVARWMKAHELDAAVFPMPTYLWPGVESVLDGSQNHGVLRLPKYSGKIELLAISDSLDAALRCGGIRIGALPNVYHGLISKRALDRLKARAGTYFPGPSPDMANAVGLSAVVDRFARLSLPIVVSGVCRKSGAAEGARHVHEGEIADKAILAAGTAQTWPSEVPFYFSGPTLYAASLVRALVATGRASLIERLRFDRLYAACCVFNPAYRGRVSEARERNPKLAPTWRMAIAIAWIWWLRGRALAGNLLQKTIGSAKGDRVVGLGDIGEVIAYMTQRWPEFVAQRLRSASPRQ